MTADAAGPAPRFRHEAFLYASVDDFVDRAAVIVLRALDAGEPVLVAIDPAKIELLRERLGDVSSVVAWKDIRGIGANPARIIPLWRQFVSRHETGRRLWGFGEPIWPERAADEMVEAQRHEQLLNLAFADAHDFTLLCPYDTQRLRSDVVLEAHRSHPLISEPGRERTSADYPGLAAVTAAVPPSLPEPGEEPAELVVGTGNAGVRSSLARLGFAAPLGAARTDDLTLAIVAVAGSMGRPGAPGAVRVWRQSGAVLAELRDLVPAADPLAGREWPPPSEGPARGLWLANQLCDLVQVRRDGTGAVVRLHVATAR
jgi:hypothetical protein